MLQATVPGAETSPVIVFGGSYGGMLAAWFRFCFLISTAIPLRNYVETPVCEEFCLYQPNFAFQDKIPTHCGWGNSCIRAHSSVQVSKEAPNLVDNQL